MRIAIWQQYSSNHSSSFTAVGVFKTAEDAQRAGEALRKTVDGIAAWYARHPDVSRAVLDGQSAPTRAEAIIRTQFNVDPVSAIDWLANGCARQDTVQVYDNLVFIKNGCETWLGATPFDAVLSALGGETFVDVQAAESILVDIACTAADEAQAKSIEAQLSSYLLRPSPTFPPPSTLLRDLEPFSPWIAYSPYGSAATMQRLRELRHKYADAQASTTDPVEARRNKLADLSKRAIQAYKDGDKELAEELHRQMETAKRQPPNYYGELTTAELAQLRQSMLVTEARIPDWAAGGVTQDGAHIDVRGILMLRLDTCLPALTAWLQDEHCKSIEYSFEQH
jgi:hypothetical protein